MDKVQKYASINANIIRLKTLRMRWAEHVAHKTERRNAYKILIDKPEGKR
jgi:hypothetical protein